MEYFFTFSFFSQYAGDPGIRYPKIDSEGGYIDDTYLRRLKSTNHLLAIFYLYDGYIKVFRQNEKRNK